MVNGACDCGCCDGPERRPETRHNPPGCPAVAYRVGTHASFKAALLARLSSSDYPALAALRTRRDDDLTIAICDDAAALLDVFTFYQERYVNEFFIRTATERRTLVELARLIGYRPSPGVAAATRLAFMLEDAPGVRSLAAEPVTIPRGTRVQSVPGPGEDPQTFETVEPVTARVEWNAMAVQVTARQTFSTGLAELFVPGVAVQAQEGDVLLMVGDERLADENSTRWDARVVRTVARDNGRQVTRLGFAPGLGQGTPATTPAALNPRAYIFRHRAALFGHNAPDPRLLFNNTSAPTGMTVDDGGDAWVGYDIQNDRLDLDSPAPKVLAESWVLLAGGDGDSGLASLPGLVELCRAAGVRHLSRSAYGMSGRITRLTPDKTSTLSKFELPTTVVFAQSEALALAERPLDYPLYGTDLALAVLSPLFVPGQELAVSGRRQRLRIAVDDPALAFQPDGAAAVPLAPGDSFAVAESPAELVNGVETIVSPPDVAVLLRQGGATLRWRLIDRDGAAGVLDAPASAVELQAAGEDDPVIRELCAIDDSDTAVSHDRDRTALTLAAPLVNVYDRRTTTVCANVARATHGEGVSEIAGSGNAAAAGQQFALRQAPLTYTSAATPDGRQSALEVRVNGLLWDEAPALFEQPADARVYALRQDGDGRTIVQFGDGVEGARLPSGQDNVRFTYRKNLGLGGNLVAGRLTSLLGRPLGVKTVTNVAPATGGDDPEAAGDLRRHAPLTTLTLGRAVSLQDYTDFARSFAGIARARAAWMGRGAARGIVVTVAGPAGAAVAADSETMQNLTAALRQYGDPLVPLTVQSYASVVFRMEATLEVADDAIDDDVIEAVETALRAHFGFEAREFGDAVSVDEVMAVMQGVAGVAGANVTALYRLDPGASPALDARLFAYPPQLQPDGTVTAAELLTLDAAPVSIGVMP
jgi:hypothetical protein